MTTPLVAKKKSVCTEVYEKMILSKQFTNELMVSVVKFLAFPTQHSAQFVIHDPI